MITQKNKLSNDDNNCDIKLFGLFGVDELTNIKPKVFNIIHTDNNT